MLRIFTHEEKVEELDLIIGAFEQSARYHARTGAVSRRKNFAAASERSVAVLKAIAADLRARAPGTATATLESLRQNIEKVAASKTSLGYEERQLIQLAHDLIGRWPAVRQALENSS